MAKKRMQEEFELLKLEKEVAGHVSGIANAQSASEIRDIIASLNGLSTMGTGVSPELAEKLRAVMSYILTTKSDAQGKLDALVHAEAVESMKQLLPMAGGNTFGARPDEHLAQALTGSLWRDPDNEMRKIFESIDPNADVKVERFDDQGRLIEKPDGKKETVKGQKLRDDIALVEAYTNREKLATAAKAGDKEAQKAIEAMNLQLYGHKDGLDGFNTAEEKAAAQKRAELKLKEAMENVDGHAAAKANSKEEKEQQGQRLKENKEQLEKVTAATTELARLEEEKTKLPPGMSDAADQVIQEKKEELRREQQKLDDQMTKNNEVMMAANKRRREELQTDTAKTPMAPGTVTARIGFEGTKSGDELDLISGYDPVRSNAKPFILATPDANLDALVATDPVTAKSPGVAGVAKPAEGPGANLDALVANDPMTAKRPAVAEVNLDALVAADPMTAKRPVAVVTPDANLDTLVAVDPMTVKRPAVAVATPDANLDALVANDPMTAKRPAVAVARPDANLDALVANDPMTAKRPVAAVTPDANLDALVAVDPMTAKRPAVAEVPSANLDALVANDPMTAKRPAVAVATPDANLDALVANDPMTAKRPVVAVPGANLDALVAADPVTAKRPAVAEVNLDALVATDPMAAVAKKPEAEVVAKLAVKPEIPQVEGIDDKALRDAAAQYAAFAVKKPEITLSIVQPTPKPETLLGKNEEPDLDAILAGIDSKAVKDAARAAVAKELPITLASNVGNDNITPVRYEGPALPVNKSSITPQASRV